MTTPTLPLAVAAGVTAALIYRRHRRRPDPRGEARPIPTTTELRDMLRESTDERLAEHRAGHRFRVTLYPEIRGTICHTCGDVMC